MTRARIAPGATPNPQLTELAREPNEANFAWLRRALVRVGPGLHVVLLGGSGLIDFRLRVAQSQLRADMLPSYWSHAIALYSAAPPAIDGAWQVSLAGTTRLERVPGANAIQAAVMEDFDDPRQHPNIALLHFPAPPDPLDDTPVVTADAVAAAVADLQKARLAEDLVTPLVRWLGFVWGAEDASNPLLQRVPMPSARLTELVFAAFGIDINPGTAGHFTCPEAIWNAAMWWSQYYAGVAQDPAAPAPPLPRGLYVREPYITLIEQP